VPCAFNLTLDAATAFGIERIYAELMRLGIPEQDLMTQYGQCVTLLVVSDRVHPDSFLKLLELQLPAMAAVAVDLTGPRRACSTTWR